MDVQTDETHLTVDRSGWAASPNPSAINTGSQPITVIAACPYLRSPKDETLRARPTHAHRRAGTRPPTRRTATRRDRLARRRSDATRASGPRIQARAHPHRPRARPGARRGAALVGRRLRRLRCSSACAPGSPRCPEAISAGAVGGIVERHAAASGVREDRRTAHALRHTFCTMLAERGAALMVNPGARRPHRRTNHTDLRRRHRTQSRGYRRAREHPTPAGRIEGVAHRRERGLPCHGSRGWAEHCLWRRGARLGCAAPDSTVEPKNRQIDELPSWKVAS